MARFGHGFTSASGKLDVHMCMGDKMQTVTL